MTAGKNIKAAREEAGISPKPELAGRIGTTRQQIKGMQKPTRKT